MPQKNNSVKIGIFFFTFIIAAWCGIAQTAKGLGTLPIGTKITKD